MAVVRYRMICLVLTILQKEIKSCIFIQTIKWLPYIESHFILLIMEKFHLILLQILISASRRPACSQRDVACIALEHFALETDNKEDKSHIILY